MSEQNVTAETITNADLRELGAWLERALLDVGMARCSEPVTPTLHAEWTAARERCATLLTARRKETP